MTKRLPIQMEISPFEAGKIVGKPTGRTDACEIHRAANIIHIVEKMIHCLNVLVEMKKVKRDVKRIALIKNIIGLITVN